MQFVHYKVVSAQDGRGRPVSTWAFYARGTGGLGGFVVAIGPYRFALVR